MILEALQIPSDIQANNNISKAEMHAEFDARCELVIFVGYSSNQQGFLVWSQGAVWSNKNCVY